jgi:acetyltransferase-like isoleucine patch superfamily enzyme
MQEIRRDGGYVDVQYRQYNPSPKLEIARTLAGILTWPVVVPMALMSKVSVLIFCTFSEVLAFVPYLLGVIVRFEFYRMTLNRVGKNVVIELGTVFNYPDVEIGDHVLIGRYNVVHHCDFGDYVMTAERCTFLSGTQYHSFERVDTPMALQGGRLRRIRISNDCWIGTAAVVAADVGEGSVVGAGSVVIHEIEPFSVAVGTPARVIKKRR